MDFTNLSKGLELDKDGHTFTSSSQTLNDESIIISKPYISKH
jgi:hypothetical protein